MPRFSHFIDSKYKDLAIFLCALWIWWMPTNSCTIFIDFPQNEYLFWWSISQQVWEEMFGRIYHRCMEYRPKEGKFSCLLAAVVFKISFPNTNIISTFLPPSSQSIRTSWPYTRCTRGFRKQILLPWRFQCGKSLRCLAYLSIRQCSIYSTEDLLTIMSSYTSHDYRDHISMIYSVSLNLFGFLIWPLLINFCSSLISL